MKPIVVIILFLVLFGCSNESSISEIDVDKLSQEQLIEIYEGERYLVQLNKDINYSELVVSANYDIFFEIKEDSLEIIGPNVLTDRQITFDIKYIDSSGISKTESLNIIVNNVSLTIPSVMPEPYAFSSSTGKYEDTPLSVESVPLSNYKGELIHIPAFVAAYAYNQYREYYYTSNDSAKDKFMNSVNWLKNNCIYTKYGFCSLRYFLRNDYYEVDQDWTSAMAQGQALSSFIAAAYLANDDSYLRVAYDALSAFNYEAKDKGVSSYRGSHLWYEEYASATLKSGVLNGYLFAMAGLYDFMVQYPQLELSRVLFENGTSILEDELPKFDIKFTSLYNVNHDSEKYNQISSAMGSSFDAYHELHIYQLAWLYEQTGSEVILEHFGQFIGYDFGHLELVALNGTGLTDKYININGSPAANPDSFGYDKLTDENWTYGAYWSTKHKNAFIDIELNSDFLDVQFIDKVVLVFLAESQVPENLTIYSKVEDELQALTTISFSDEVIDTQTYNVANYTAIVKTIPVNTQTAASNILRLEFDNQQLLALRELNVTYSRTELERVLRDLYD